MGIYDRDYNRASNYEPGRFGLGTIGGWSLTNKLVLVTFGVYVVQLVTRPANSAQLRDAGWFTDLFALHADWFRHPWLVFELLTSGFLHDVFDFKHILFNMLGLWLFGRELENRYGQREYLAFYLTAIVFSGLTWMLGEALIGWDPLRVPRSYGASGGVVALVILFAFNYPHRTVYFMFVLPMPMWVAGLILVAMDVMGAVNRTDNIAFTAHLGGALFAALYFKSGIRLTQWMPDANWRKWLRARPKLRVHHPEDDEDQNDTEQRVDEILKKIQEKGQDSLTRSERRFLEEASREYQRKRK